jgi:ribosomal protein S18 acetylase RimI-like enzyme
MEDDSPLLVEMLAEAVNWNPTRQPLSTAEVLAHPHFMHYIEAWPRPDDFGRVAEDERSVWLGAAWCRYFTAANPGYGFVDASIPELTIGVVASARGRGVGAALLSALLDEATRRGSSAVSLSVEKENPAARLYERHGFAIVRDDRDAWTMKVDLRTHERPAD